MSSGGKLSRAEPERVGQALNNLRGIGIADYTTAPAGGSAALHSAAKALGGALRSKPAPTWWISASAIVAAGENARLPGEVDRPGELLCVTLSQATAATPASVTESATFARGRYDAASDLDAPLRRRRRATTTTSS